MTGKTKKPGAAKAASSSGAGPDDEAEVRQLQDRFNAVVEEAMALAERLTPITDAMVVAAPTWRAAYSDRTCALMASLCAIAYDNFEDPTGVSLGTMRARLKKGGFDLVATYTTSIGTQAYLATSDQMTVLAFRGTQDFADWEINLASGRKPLRAGDDTVCVHEGFLRAFRSVEQAIAKDLAGARVPQDKGLYINGHSLGGALAQIASAAFERDTLAACYTFGSPRVGQRSFDTEVKCPHYRLVNGLDVVPAVPPPYLGYQHGGDVRVLGRLGDSPKRYDRTPFLLGAWLGVFSLLWPITRKFPLIDDHMIGIYRKKLIAAANLRSPGWADTA